MKKLITACFPVIILVLIIYSIIEFKNNIFSLNFFKQLNSIILCISILLFWNNYKFLGIALYNLCFIVLIILTYLSGIYLRNSIVILIYFIFDIYQISYYKKL